MFLGNRLIDAKTMRLIGLASLVLANLARWFLHPVSGFGPDLVDGTIGLLYGVSISCLLLSLRKTRIQCSTDEA
jgi:hypothetical protein